MPTDIKITLNPENYQTLLALLQMIKAEGTDTRDGPAKDALVATMAAQKRDGVVSIVHGTLKLEFRSLLAMLAEQILWNIEK